jgi:alpha-1,2-mannosyltransferase
MALMGIGSILARLPDRANQIDFSHYYTAATFLREGIDPYRLNLTLKAKSMGLEVADNPRATYPPTFLLCFEGLTRLSPLTAYWIWISFNFCVFCAAMVMLLGRRSEFDRVTAISLTGLTILHASFIDNFDYAQSQLLMLLLFVVMMRAIESRRDWLTGLSLGTAILLRVFPVIMVGYLVVRRRWRALGFTIGWIAIGAALTVAIVGVRTAIDFSAAFPFLTQTAWLARQANVSLNAFIARAFVYALGYPLSDTVNTIRLAVEIAAAIGLCALTVRATAARSSEQPDPDMRAFCLWVATTIMLAPTAWLHYLVLLFIPFTRIFYAASMDRTSRRAYRMMIVSYLALQIPLMAANLLKGWIPDGIILVIRECPFTSLVIAYISAYWFVSDTGDSRQHAESTAELSSAALVNQSA